MAGQITLHAPLIREDAPYEGYDEVATYNGTRVLSGPTANWIYRYGSLDTFLQLIGLHYFLSFDPVGPEFHHFSYSNNDYDSLNNEFYAFGQIKPTELGYNYFRGIDDHRPIVLSRRLHFGVFYGLAAAAGLLWIAVLGLDAVWLLLPMLCLTVNSATFQQADQSLPNAIDAILCFIIVVSIGLAPEIRRRWPLYLAAALLAIALNFKIDVLPLDVILGLALLLPDAVPGLRATVLRGLTAFGIFLAALVATDPSLLIDPRQRLKWLIPPVNHAGYQATTVFFQNLLTLARSLKLSMLPAAAQLHVWTWVLPVVILTGGAIIGFVLRRRPAVLSRLVLPGLAVGLLLLIPVAMVRDYYARYEMNGLAAFYAMVGIGLLCFLRRGGPTGRRIAFALAAVLVVQYGLLARDGAAMAARAGASSSMVLWGEGNSGYSQLQSRNTIEWHAIETILAGGYDRTILVDQHAYLDLRPLRLAGLTPVYVNIDTLDAVLARLDPARPHLLLFSPGSYGTDPSWWQPWMTRWSPELDQRYDAYLAKLARFPVLADTGGPPQRLFWTGPVDRLDRMKLAAVPAQDPQR
ncbi:MAG: hypothetical protein WDN69_32980 [Aliidongia sp.]